MHKDPEAGKAYYRSWRVANKERLRAYGRAYYLKHKPKITYRLERGRMLRVYGLTESRYNELLKAQGGVCALPGCGRTELVIDHDHVTGVVRGLLCVAHNGALGKFHDDPQELYNAIEYLRKTLI